MTAITPSRVLSAVALVTIGFALGFWNASSVAHAQAGKVYEMRTYTHAAGHLPKLRKIWETAVPERLKFSPLTAAWYSEVGPLNKFVHIWPYPTLDARNETRAKTSAAGVWPPSAEKLGLPGYELVHQENKIVMPSAFSPLQ